MSDFLMDLSNVDTAALLPSVIAEDPVIEAMLASMDTFWQQIAPAIPLLGVLATIDQQPDDVVDKLAYQFHVDYYDANWPLATRRRVVKDSIRLHRLAGTRGAVEDIISSIWDDGAILTEWWEYGGEPGTFQVALANEQTQDNVDLFLASIRKVKRATDHLTITTLNECDPGAVNAAAVYHQYTHYRLEA